jgi:hypothetical protein
MNPLDYISMIAIQQREELLREAEKSRMLIEAFKDNAPKTNRIANFLAYFGNKLQSMGYSLEKRYRDQREPQTTLNPQTNPGGCT